MEDPYVYWLNAVASWRMLFPRLYRLAFAMRRHEGWFDGSRSWRNNNPGNLRKSKFEVSNVRGFSTFSNEHHGFFAAIYDLHCKCSGRTATGLGPKKTISDLIAVYAPPGDNNDVSSYVQSVIGELEIKADTKLSWFVEV